MTRADRRKVERRSLGPARCGVRGLSANLLKGRPVEGRPPKIHCTGYETFASTVTRRREPNRPPAIGTSL